MQRTLTISPTGSTQEGTPPNNQWLITWLASRTWDHVSSVLLHCAAASLQRRNKKSELTLSYHPTRTIISLKEKRRAWISLKVSQRVAVGQAGLSAPCFCPAIRAVLKAASRGSSTTAKIPSKKDQKFGNRSNHLPGFTLRQPLSFVCESSERES